jgi:hypothetical protein
VSLLEEVVMYRFAALSLTCLMLAPHAVAAPPLLPPGLAGAEMRPTMTPAASQPLVLEAALHPVDPPAPAPSLAARLAMAPRLIARVDVSEQVMRVVLDGQVIHTFKVSTAGKGYRTPRGEWQPYRMHTMWHSRKYDNAPMPHSIFFTGGYAIHATPHVRRLGRPASHGCVRLHPDDAKVLFQMTKDVGRSATRVVVID